MASSFFAPVVIGVYWKRATRHGAASAMLIGVTTTFLWKAWGSSSIDPVLPGFVLSVSSFVVVSLLTDPPSHRALAPYFSEPSAPEDGP